MTAVDVPLAVPVAPVRVALWRRLVRRPLGLASLLFLAFVAVIAIIGPWIAPQDPNYADIRNVLSPPSAEHILGTDGSGRDVLSRLLVATQISVSAALLALVVAVVLGVTSGLIAGYYQGWFNSTATWVTELNMALPGIVVLLAARAVLGPSVWISMFIFGILLAPAFYRLVYASVTAVRSELYVDAARVSGLSDTRIIGRHVLSVVRAPIIIQGAIIAGIAIAIQSGLEFLGLGDISVPTWGQMLNDGFKNIYKEPILMLWPSLAIGLTCIALTLLANVMRDELERTVSVRRKRRRAVATATGSIAAVTTSLSTGGGDVVDLDEPPIFESSARHRPPGRRAQQGDREGAGGARSPRRLRPAGRLAHRGRPRRLARHPQGRGARSHRRVGLGQDADGVRRAGPAPPRRSRHRRLDPVRGHRARRRRRPRIRRHPGPAHRLHPAGADVEPRPGVHDRHASSSSRCGRTSGSRRRRRPTARSSCSPGSASRTRSARSTRTRSRSPAAWRSAC